MDLPSTQTYGQRVNIETQALGIVTWNVNHCSNYNIKALLRNVKNQLAAFSEDHFYDVMARVEALIGLLLTDPDIIDCMEHPDNYRAFGFVPSSTFKQKFAGLQNPTIKLVHLCALIKQFRATCWQIRMFEFGDALSRLATINWQQKYEEAQRSREKRMAFFQEIKRIQTVEDALDEMKDLLKMVTQLLTYQTFILRFFPGMQQDAQAEFFDNFFVTQLNFPNKEFLTQLSRGLRSMFVVIHAQEMFKENADWLDLVILQEVNDPALLVAGQGADTYKLYSGPHLLSSSGREGGQNEYFPLLVRANANIQVADSCYVVRSDAIRNKKPIQLARHGEEIPWEKYASKLPDGNTDVSLYRPIIVYEVIKQTPAGARLYWIGVVHTTPVKDSSGEVSEYHRQKIYEEVSEGLKWLEQQARERNIPLIVGGDYYLSAEAVVKHWGLAKLIDAQEFQRLQTLIRQELAKSEQILNSIVGPAPVNLREWFRLQQEAARAEQILRNTLQLTVAAQIERLGLRLAQPVSGTNPKHRPLNREDWLYLQIADFFVYNQQFAGVAVGILRPQGKILPVDTEDLFYSRYWQWFSDHFPVAAIFSLVHKSDELLGYQAIAGAASEKAIELAHVSNENRFARLQLSSGKQPVDLSPYTREQIKQLSITYLQGRLERLNALIARTSQEQGRGETTADVVMGREEPALDVASLIELISSLEDALGIAASERLFVTRSEDFEADDDAQIDGEQESSGSDSSSASRSESDDDETEEVMNIDGDNG